MKTRTANSKNIFFCIMAMILTALFAGIPAVQVAAESYEYTDDEQGLIWSYTLDADNNATITNCKNADENSPSVEIVIPDKVGDYPVTALGSGSSVFSKCRGVTKVTIPVGVKTIGNHAFIYRASLVDVTIPESVTTIGDQAFFSCTRITNITIPEEVTTIGSAAFAGCTSLASVNIPDGITSIKSSLFWQCGNLTTIMVPENVNEIDANAFASCYKLKIQVAEENQNYMAIDGALYSKDKKTLIAYPSADDCIVPEGVTTIGKMHFTEMPK